MQKGFITIPILIIALLGITVVGGGGYAVYKVNQVQQESDQRVAELERKMDEVVVTPTMEEAEELTEFATSTEEITDEVKSIEVPTAVNPSTPKLAPVAQVVQSASSPEFNYIVTTTLDNEIRNANELLKVFPPIYEFIDYERQRFIKVRGQTASNLRAIGMTESQVNSEGIILLYDEYINWTANAKNLIRVYEDTLLRSVDLFYKGKTDLANQKLTSLQDAEVYLKNYYQKEYVLGISSDIDREYTRIKDFVSEYHGILLSKLDSSSQIASPSIPPLNLPKINSTNCTVNFGNISCDTISY